MGCPQPEGPYPALHILERCISRKTKRLYKGGEERVKEPIKVKERKGKEIKEEGSKRGGRDEDKMIMVLCSEPYALCIC